MPIRLLHNAPICGRMFLIHAQGSRRAAWEHPGYRFGSKTLCAETG